jgi:hypothetical protein
MCHNLDNDDNDDDDDDDDNNVKIYMKSLTRKYSEGVGKF